MQTRFFARPFVAILILVTNFFVSCDDEISDFGGGVLTGTEIVITQDTIKDISAKEISTEATIANNLSYNILGKIESDNYSASYNILSQIYGVSESFTESIVEDDDGNITKVIYDLESAELVIPYRYTLDETDTDNETETYNIDSKVSGVDNPILNIKVYKSNYELQNSGPESTSTDVYYSNRYDPIKRDIINLESLSFEEIGFTESPINLNSIENSSSTINYTEEDNEIESCDDGDGYTIDGTLEDDEKWLQLEAIRIPLSDNFENDLLEILIDEDIDDVDDNGVSDEISSDALTDEYIYKKLPGIYIETESESSGAVEVMEYNEGLINPGILLTFTKTTTDSEDDSCVKEYFYTTILMNTDNGRAINFIETTSNEIDETDETILLQGGRGSTGLLSLFDDLNNLNNWAEDNVLLNDAELVLTLNNEDYNVDSLLSNKTILEEGESVPLSDDDDYDEDSDIEYCNIMITELINGNSLLDYSTNSILDTDTEASLQQKHLVPLSKSGEDYVFKINITEYLASLLDRDPVNDDEIEDLIETEDLQLLISPTNNITLTSSTRIQDDEQNYNSSNIFVNQGSVLSFDTLPIYGSNASDESKRPYIIVKYTSTK